VKEVFNVETNVAIFEPLEEICQLYHNFQ
jgi:hypothetical protein